MILISTKISTTEKFIWYNRIRRSQIVVYFSCSYRIRIRNTVITAIGKQIESRNITIRSDIAIRIQESSDFWIVVSCLQVVESRLGWTKLCTRQLKGVKRGFFLSSPRAPTGCQGQKPLSS